MASSVRGRLAIDIQALETVADPGSGKKQKEHALRLLIDLANGTANGLIDKAYSTTATGIGASVTTVYDLAGSLTDLNGDTITFAEVYLIAIRNRSSTAANYLAIGPDATAGFGVVTSNRGFWGDASDKNIVPADFDSQTGDGSWVILFSRGGVPVAAGSTDELAVITQGGTSANTWDLVILGRSA